MTTERDSLLLRGVLDLCVMALMDPGPLYGYSVVGRLAEHGLSVAPGSVYPLLARLERTGLITGRSEPSESGPPRRWWSLTAAGASALDDGRATWVRMSRAIDASLDLPVT